MSPPSYGSNASSTRAAPRPGCCATPPRPPSTSRTGRSPPPRRRGHPRALESRKHLALQPRRDLGRRPLAHPHQPGRVRPPAQLRLQHPLRQIRPTPSARIAAEPVSQASKPAFTPRHSKALNSPGRAAVTQRPKEGPYALRRPVVKARSLRFVHQRPSLRLGNVLRQDQPSLLVGRPSFSIFKAATSVANRSLVGSAAGSPSVASVGIPIGVRPSGLAAGLPPSTGTTSSWTFGVFMDFLLELYAGPAVPLPSTAALATAVPTSTRRNGRGSAQLDFPHFTSHGRGCP